MDDMTAFDRQIAGEVLLGAGPSEPVDDLAIFDAVTAASQRKGWGFTMFSALKFVAAAAIVALFGGFLLAGILSTPQGDEMAPAAVTGSPSPMTTEELLSGMVTEEVEPGVFRVIADGALGLPNPSDDVPPPSSSIVAGEDGSIWLARSGDLVRLGYSKSPDLRVDQSDVLAAFTVTPDGTVWAVVRSEGGPSRLLSFDGDTWTTHPDTGRPWEDFQQGYLEVAPSGRVWAARVGGALSYLEADGSTWQTTEGPESEDPPEPGWYGFIATDSGVWTPSVDGVWHYADGTWEHIPYGGPDTEAMPDDVFWGLANLDSDPSRFLYRHDATGWQRWSGEERGMLASWSHTPNAYAVAPDGSFWLASDAYGLASDTVDYPGIGRFDGQTWTGYLPGMLASGMDIAPDGSVWLVAREWAWDDEQSQPSFGEANLYVITPEAVAAE